MHDTSTPLHIPYTSKHTTPLHTPSTPSEHTSTSNHVHDTSTTLPLLYTSTSDHVHDTSTNNTTLIIHLNFNPQPHYTLQHLPQLQIMCMTLQPLHIPTLNIHYTTQLQTTQHYTSQLQTTQHYTPQHYTIQLPTIQYYTPQLQTTQHYTPQLQDTEHCMHTITLHILTLQKPPNTIHFKLKPVSFKKPNIDY